VGQRAWVTKNRNKWWNHIAQKHGFEVQILATWDDEESAFEHEKALISCFRDMGHRLVNISDGGQGPSGFRHTKEARDRMSAVVRERMKSEETRQRISEKLKGLSKGRTGKLSEEEIVRRTETRHRNTRRFTYGDKSLTIAEWSQMLGLPNTTVRYRFQIGASPYEKRSRRGEPGTLTYKQ
jgi:hypothetical protein